LTTARTWPDLTSGWRIDATSVPHPERGGKAARVFTCRRFGVTWQIRHDPGEGWTGRKFKGGKIIEELSATRLPARTRRKLEDRWRTR
jgi:hypothetical protein